MCSCVSMCVCLCRCVEKELEGCKNIKVVGGYCEVEGLRGIFIFFLVQ